VLKEKVESNERKGMGGKALRAMVAGIPNTGKSSFINRMAGKNKAKVADRPGVTRSNQWFDIGNGILLLDTPGVLWPKFEDPAVADRLAFIGSVKDEVMDIESLAVRFLRVLKTAYPERLTERYALTDFEQTEDYALLELLAKKRGMLISGGHADTERAAVMLLDEYRGGKLGRLTLEHVV
jgi:ribosome biogenesis GTPase A